MKEKKKKKKKVGQVKDASEGLEGFVDWTDTTVNESAEEREANMSSLAVGFAMQMCKQVVNALVETTLDSEGPNDKRSRQSSPE